MRQWIVILCAAALAAAQEPAGFEYTCSEDDIKDFGLTCSEQEPCQVFLEIAQAEASGATVALTGNLHTQTTTLWGLLLVSLDGGKSWTEPAKRVKSAALEHIQFTDPQHGWVSGVMLEPLPRNPFFLVTADGGKTWRRRDLFEDTHFGSIQQFWFDSERSGELILDQSQGASASFERYTTMTGGDAWEPVEITRTQPRLARAPPRGDPSWRVRADSRSGSYRVERRAAPNWEMIAEFPIIAAECK